MSSVPNVALERLFFFFRTALVVLMAVLPVGCAVLPPVQEMSDARQAIHAAREAKADHFAPEPFHQAERFMEVATQDLERGAYDQARSAAMAAKAEAIKARDRALVESR